MFIINLLTGGIQMQTLAVVKEAYLTKMERINRSQSTIRTYKNQIQGFIRFIDEKYNVPLEMKDVTVEDVEEYIYELKDVQGWKVNSVNLVISTLNGFFAYAAKKQIIEYNIMQDVDQLKKQKVTRDFLTADEVGELIHHIQQPLIRLIVETLAYTGLRISECLNLQLADVDFNKGMIQVIEGKGGKDRIVPMNDALQNKLMMYRDTQRPHVSTTNFFALERTGSVSQQYVNREIKEATKKAKIEKNVSCHTLRHSFASTLVKKGVNLPTVAKLLGHADFRMVTSIYVHMEDSELEAAVNQLSI